MDKLALRPYQALVIRLVLGGVFVWAGAAKLVQIPSFVETVAAFDMLPADWAAPFALSVIWIELIAGGLLLLDIWPRSNALVFLILLVVFSAALGINMYHGNDVTCGCFGGDRGTSLAWVLLRDLFLAGGAALLLAQKE
ncbi:MAG: DoxX family protein [Gemmatimonadetes bacterium]|nr:DoxX family protein [Gemmatimonadota bacterium]